MRKAIVLLALSCTPSEPASPPPQTAVPESTAEPEPRPESKESYWVERSDAELDLAIEQACARAGESSRPLLLQFSASWCIDCKKIRALSKEQPLATELGRWESLVIDPGRFDRHKGLLDAFEVSRLATWVAVSPTDCQLPAPAWQRLAHSSFEPATGAAVSAAELTSWLAQARQKQKD